MAEILSIKSNKDNEQMYYIHYIDYNKRLDEWVGKDRLNLLNVQFPKRDTKSNLKNGSRPSSPDREIVISDKVRIFFKYMKQLPITYSILVTC